MWMVMMMLEDFGGFSKYQRREWKSEATKLKKIMGGDEGVKREESYIVIGGKGR